MTADTLKIELPHEFAGREVKVTVRPADLRTTQPSASDNLIIDHGRGPQLAGSRITVQDVFPYLQECYWHAEIAEIMPLTLEQIAAVERYVHEHEQEVLAEDQRIRARNAARKNPPEVEAVCQAAQQHRLSSATIPRGDGEAGGARDSG